MAMFNSSCDITISGKHLRNIHLTRRLLCTPRIHDPSGLAVPESSDKCNRGGPDATGLRFWSPRVAHGTPRKSGDIKKQMSHVTPERNHGFMGKTTGAQNEGV